VGDLPYVSQQHRGKDGMIVHDDRSGVPYQIDGFCESGSNRLCWFQESHVEVVEARRPTVGDAVEVIAAKVTVHERYVGRTSIIVHDNRSDQPYQLEGMEPAFFFQSEVEVLDESATPRQPPVQTQRLGSAAEVPSGQRELSSTESGRVKSVPVRSVTINKLPTDTVDGSPKTTYSGD